MTTKIPAELSSTPSIVDNGDATAITIDSSEKSIFSGDVEVGTTAPKINLKNTDTSIVADQSLGVIEVESSDGSTGSAGTIAKLDIAASGTFDGSGHGSDFRFITGATNQSGSISLSEKLRIQTTGGISFNGDTAAANALDDYEEGTFTPTVTSGITSVGYAVQTGYYTKIGNLVLFNLRIATSSGNAQSSTFAVGNLPFNSALTQQPGGAGVRAYASSFSSSGSQAFIGPASNSISFYTLAGTAFAGTSIVNHDDFDLRITGIYRA
jgi:hypothetical protein